MRVALLIAMGFMAGLGATFGAGASAQAPAARLNVVVVCVNCIPDGMPDEAYNRGTILLNQSTGDLWFYPALSPGVKPRLLGTLTAPGTPLAAPRTP